ncbi:uncharacterized protein I206_106176 [Kwoniella pini CBS 10737]|uniref:Uncharacterized protein n=1 Tax=Kwoniella pini CBS 10737 TaxID=1296096 RepID=A0A1B9I189_9TREE|nr:uncharacterized protein I206_05001 [Kwoniella pini CBS 10737]OCF49310.1 hypothetical protein I206_05001 [Kwoniella pini CBS 10737]
MDALRPGHAHRSSSDRLLNNYLDAQKSLSTSLLTLISHSHSSTSSLLAYVTSSPGVIVPIRKAVRHAAFEGPLSPELMNDPHGGFDVDNHGQGGWASYISSLDQFRKDLKQIHLLEEELSRVKRDREILVTRLIKTTKSRPTRSDLSALATSYSTHNGPAQSSRSSVLSMSSNGSGTVSTKEGKRAGKLADAQAELLGCEEHLRSLEVRIENERNKVMMRGLEERFRAMDVVGRMWVQQSKKGLRDLERLQDLPPDAFELDSNGSLAPSQSASQIAYEDSSHRGVPFPRGFGHPNGPGSITGSIQEEDEDGSSADEAQGGTLVVHENRPGSRASALHARGGGTTPKPSPLGVPSVNTQARPLSSTIGASRGGLHGDDSDDEPTNFRSGGRRAASDVGGMAYRPPTGRQPLRRTFSDEQHNNSAPPRRANSDSSSIRSQKKKKGFFASLGRLFKGSSSTRKSRSGRESPPYGASAHNRRSSGGGWHTRTDSNIKRGGTVGRRGGGGDDSSSDEDTGNFVSVTNNRNSTWSIDNQRDPKGSIKRSSTMPIASGLIPAKPAAKSDLGMKRNSSQSTITGNRPRSMTPLPASAKANTTANQGSLSRSNTVKSSMSVASAKSTGTVKSTGTAKKKTRTNGSIARASITAQQAAEGRNIMQIVDGVNGNAPKMPEVPKAPKSQVTPQMELPKAPGSSLVHPEPLKSQAAHTNGDIPTLGRTISRSNSVKKVPAAKSDHEVPATSKKEKDTSPKRSTTPLPPSRLLSPPLKSALRPSSPLPPSPPTVHQEPPKPMFSITAPGPVQLPAEPEPAPEERSIPPSNNKRNSYHSMTSDGASIYESANEGDGSDEDGQGSSADEDDDMGYKVVENEKVRRAGEIATAGRYVEDGDGDDTASDHTVEAGPTFTGNGNNRAPPPGHISVPPPSSAVGSNIETASTVSRRKSVRMAIPDSPIVEKAPPPITKGGKTTDNAYQPPNSDYGNGNGNSNEEIFKGERPNSPEPERIKEDWSTRIGRMREDTSDEDDLDPNYSKIRKNLSKIDKKWDALNSEEKERQQKKDEVKLKKRNSIKSNKSNKSRNSRI